MQRIDLNSGFYVGDFIPTCRNCDSTDNVAMIDSYPFFPDGEWGNDLRFDVMPVWHCKKCKTTFAERTAVVENSLMMGSLNQGLRFNNYQFERRLASAIRNGIPEIQSALSSAMQSDTLQSNQIVVDLECKIRSLTSELESKIDTLKVEFEQKIAQLVLDALTDVRQRVKAFQLE
jgi:hypothetical protein